LFRSLALFDQLKNDSIKLNDERNFISENSILNSIDDDR
jgi:hypothetical protein